MLGDGFTFILHYVTSGIFSFFGWLQEVCVKNRSGRSLSFKMDTLNHRKAMEYTIFNIN